MKAPPDLLIPFIQLPERIGFDLRVVRHHSDQLPDLRWAIRCNPNKIFATVFAAKGFPVTILFGG